MTAPSTETAPDRPSRGRYRWGAGLLALAALYFVGEALAAAGWQGRPYAWTADAISLFGVPEVQGWRPDTAFSSRHALMNATFIGTGVRLAVAAVLLAPFAPRRGRRTVVTLALVNGLGLVVVGCFPTGMVPLRGALHGLGAVATFYGGALLVIAVSINLWRARRGLALLAAGLAALALIGIVGMFLVPPLFGITERMTVYAPLVWQAVAGVVLLASGQLARPTATSR